MKRLVLVDLVLLPCTIGRTMLLRLISIAGVLLIAGCSSSASKKNALSENNWEQTSANIEEKLTAIVKQAQDKGPAAVKFIASDLFIKATDASLQGNAATAAFIYKYIVELEPTDRYLQKKYAIELVKINQIDSAIVILEKILSEKSSDFLELCLVLGELNFLLGKYDLAQKMYLRILAVKSTDKDQLEDACISLVKLYGADKNFGKAHEMIGRCSLKLPRSAQLAYYRGKILVNEQKLAAAQQAFRLAIKLDPDFVQAVIALGVLLEQEEKIGQASSIYQEYLDRGTMNEVVLGQQVNALDALGKWDELLPLLEEYVKLDASNFNVRAKLGVLYYGQKKYQQALKVFLALEKEFPGSDKILYYLGVINRDLAEWPMAIKYFEQISSESPLYPDCLVQIAQIWGLMAIKEEKFEGPTFKKMETFVQKAQQEQAELKLELAITLAFYYEGKNAIDKAIATLAPLMLPEDKISDDQLYYYITLLDRNGQTTLARQVAEQIIKRNPNNAEALNFVGYSLVEEGMELGKAYHYLLQAVRLMPEDGHIRDSLAWYYYRIGDYQKAMKELKKASQAAPDEPTIIRHIVIVYRELKLYDRAQEFLAEALKKCQREEDRQELQQLQEGLEKNSRVPASQ